MHRPFASAMLTALSIPWACSVLNVEGMINFNIPSSAPYMLTAEDRARYHDHSVHLSSG